jgi:hypothetical protein
MCVVGWCKPSEEWLEAFARLRATVELTEERAAFFTILARKDNTDEEMAGIKQLEAGCGKTICF